MSLNKESIHLTPKQILSYLGDFERKLPFPNTSSYKPILKYQNITEKDLEAEVSNMMNFIGLYNFYPKCTWNQQEDGTGGSIKLDKNPNRIVNIKVSSKYKNKRKSILAILAHEVCHKYLYEYDIYWPNLTEITEISTDLCTIYVGFGDLIIEGYKDSENESQILGYLELPIYQRTLNLVNGILWQDNDNLKDDWSEPFLQDTFIKWKSNTDKRSLLIDTYKECYSLLGNISQRKEVIEQLTNQYLQFIANNYEDEENLFSENWFDGRKLKKPFSAFAGLYKEIILLEEFNNNKHIPEILGYQEYLIDHLLWPLSNKVFPSIAPENIYCPYCLKKSPGIKLIGKNTIIKCPHCKKRIVVCGDILDIKRIKENYLSFRNRILREAEDIVRTDNSNEVSRAFTKGQKEAEKRNLKTVNTFWENEKKIRKKYLELKEEHDILKQKIEKLPKFIKLMIGKKLN